MAEVLKLETRINADRETVWKALTDPKELVRWFPLEAHVKPGQGGSIHLTWQEHKFDQKIEVWQPPEHLRVAEEQHFGGAPAHGHRMIDYKLKSEGKQTVLHLEHSGFDAPSAGGRDAALNARLASTVRSCWQAQFGALKQYTEQHLGEDRTVSWTHVPAKESHAQTWARLISPKGIVSSGSLTSLKAGETYSFKAPTGDSFHGVVIDSTPDRQFAGTVENLNGGVLRIVLDHANNEPGVTIWLATYGPTAAAHAPVFEKRWTELLQKVLA